MFKLVSGIFSKNVSEGSLCEFIATVPSTFSMIESSEIGDWAQLQRSVCRLLNEIGLSAQEAVTLTTPRGKVEVDVFAIDELSVDKTQYIVECKNWATAIPQHVVHSFTTVMQETGANIGFIVSQVGLQAGAERYTQNTNIIGLTFDELQRRYFEPWWKRHFCKVVATCAEKVCFYTEPFNITRDKALEGLSSTQLETFAKIQQRYCAFAMLMWHADLATISPHYGQAVPSSIEDYKSKFVELIGEHLDFKSVYWRDLLEEICEKLAAVQQELDQLFGRDVFAEN